MEVEGITIYFMDKIIEIENSLSAINQATFQNLIKHLLHLQGYKFIGAPGSVVGKEKTSKGTPDLLFVDNGKYIFVECTTQKKSGQSHTFLKKLLNDIDHCFSEKNGGIDKTDITKVILACNEKISDSERKELIAKVNSHNPETSLKLIDIQKLALLISDFPILARTYLSIELIKGDIFSLQDYLTKTSKGLQPSLVNKFIGREDELKKCLDGLKSSDKLVLTGSAGVGKSKLAVKLLEDLSADGSIPLVIQSSPVPLYNDIHQLFHAGKNYIVLYDDANKSIEDLKCLLSIVDREKPYGLKLIITVRDYVKKDVMEALNEHCFKKITIGKFKDSEIEKMIRDNLPNTFYNFEIERKIVELAKGNARMAMMAIMAINSASPDAETNYLNNPVLLYEKYFDKVSTELNMLNQPIMLKALAIVSFFKVWKRKDTNLINILNEFGIDADKLWSAITDLHKYEILDVHTKEIAKVSDQVLATYALYKYFIDPKNAAIDYGKWLKITINNYAREGRNSLVEITNTFDYECMKPLVIPHLDYVINDISTDDQLYTFYNHSWFYKELECLSFVNKLITTLALDKLQLKNYEDGGYRCLKLLTNFWKYPIEYEYLKLALELGLDLITKQTQSISETLEFLKKHFRFEITYHNQGYARQHILLDVLLDKNLSAEKRKIADGLFLNIASTLLKWDYTDASLIMFNKIKLPSFNPPNLKKDVLALRKVILDKVFDLFDAKNNLVQKTLETFKKNGYFEELPTYDLIIREKLEKEQYSHCKFVKTVARSFSKDGIDYPKHWNYFINSEIITFSKLFMLESEYNFEKVRQKAKKKFKKYLATHSWDETKELLLRVNWLSQQQYVRWDISKPISALYAALVEKSQQQFIDAMRLIFNQSVSFIIEPYVLKNAFDKQIISGQTFLKLLNEYDFPEKVNWRLYLLACIPKEQITQYWLGILLEDFGNKKNNIELTSITKYQKYSQAFDMLKVGNQDLDNHNIISYLTQLRDQANKHLRFDLLIKCTPYFSEHPILLKKAYNIQKIHNPNFDRSGNNLEKIFKIDNNFFIEYLQSATDIESALQNLKMEYIWQLPNYSSIIEQAISIIISKTSWPTPIVDSLHPAAKLFANPEELNKIIVFLKQYLIKHNTNHNLVSVVFNIIINEFQAHFIEMLRDFLIMNKDIQIFKTISFTTEGHSYGGSKIPIIKRQIGFIDEAIKMVKALPNLLAYVDHIKRLELLIKQHKEEIDKELDYDFEHRT